MGFVNENIALTIPRVTILANTIDVIVTLPSLTITALGDTAYAEITLPVLTIEADMIGGEAASVVVTLPAPQISATILSGGVGTASLTLPAISISSTGEAAAYANLVLPAIEISAIMEPLNSWNLNATLPSIYLVGTIEQGGDAIAANGDYVVWVANKKTGVHSTYSNWNVNSHGKFNGVDVVALPDGLYTIGASLDGTTPIDAKVYWTSTDLASHRQKRLDSLSINMRALDDQQIKVVIIADEQQRRSYFKTLTVRPEGLHRFRQLMPKGLNAENWQIGFENVAGGDFVLDEVEVISVELSRRFK